MRWAIALVLLACGEDPSPPAACSRGITGIAAYDALYEGGAIHATERALRRSPVAPFERAAEIDPAALPPAARVALQNDLWGYWQRLNEDGDQPELQDTVARIIRRLALPADRIPSRIAPPPAALSHLGSFEEVGTEMPVLSHERAFGLRRVFHVLLAEDARALTSQLVALDDRGVAHATDVPGDLEVLAVRDGAAIGARLFELDRRALRCGEPALVEVDHVSRVPGIGASSFFLELDPPVAVAAMPCARCHEDDHMQSLPDARLRVEPRIAGLIDQATDLAAPIFGQRVRN
jgi:hypothetical protein